MEFGDGVVVVTGGGSGIGEGLARAAAAEGARHVVVADIHGAEAKRVAADLGGTAVTLDVRDEGAIVAMVERIEEEHGGIDLFCSNAGVLGNGGVEESNERLSALWEIHVLSHVYAARAVLPGMIARGHGYLLNTASAAGMLTQIGSMGYSVTKAADIALSEWLAITHHHQGIRVSVLCPQSIASRLLDNSPIPPDALDGLKAVITGDLMTPAEAAQICFDTMREERFLILPNPEVIDCARRKSADIDRWLEGMRRLQARMYPAGQLPGDVIVG
jgi:NAD(P)-dependent dehydrogenase (short-subunit alcohol dehydrogenase family)